MNTKEKNEVDFQHDCEQFVRNNVTYCQSSLVSKLLETDFYSWDDVTNLHEIFGQYGTREEECQACISEDIVIIDSNTGECEDCFDGSMQEIFEWWLVDSYLLNKLEELNEPVLRTEYEDYWGRTTTGQSIMMDGVIREIVKDLNEKYPK